MRANATQQDATAQPVWASAAVALHVSIPGDVYTRAVATEQRLRTPMQGLHQKGMC